MPVSAPAKRRFPLRNVSDMRYVTYVHDVSDVRYVSYIRHVFHVRHITCGVVILSFREVP